MAMRDADEGYTIRPIGWLRSELSDLAEVPRQGGEGAPELAGVFATRSPQRPNPLGLHRVTVREIAGARLLVGPIEAIEGTPVVDIKVALDPQDG